MAFRDLGRGILEEFASSAARGSFNHARDFRSVASDDPSVRLRDRPDRKNPARNASHQAAWRARQTKTRLKKLKRAEYLRNRTKRLAYQAKYERNKRTKKTGTVPERKSTLNLAPSPK